MRTPRNWLKMGAAATGLMVALMATPALAGDLKYGEGVGSLEVDDNGKYTGGSTVKELDKIPGEDAWDLNLWASLDGGRAEGPLYIEFWQKVQGQDSKVFHHEMDDYDGRRYILVNILLEGNVGFNKDRTYKVRVVQVNSRNKDVVLASGSLKLINTGREPEPEGEGGGGEGEEERESASQDELDTLAGPDEEDEPDAPTEEAPPPVEPAKKGCSVGGEYDAGINGLMILALAGLGFRRRRND